MVGEFARSKAGHDKGRLYIIVEESEDFVFLCDGRLRKLENPKCKRRKHIQPIHYKKPQCYDTDEMIEKEITQMDRLKAN